MLGMVSYSRRPKSGQIMCYLNRTYHVLLTFMHLRLAPSLDLGDNPRLDLETVLFGGFEEDLPTMRKLLVVTFAVLIMACLAQADTFYATRAAWLAATTGVSTVDFEGITSFDVRSEEHTP